MMHALKKKVGKHANKASGVAEPGAEFLDYKLKLETVKKNLSVADKRMDEAKRHWLKHVMDQRSFSAGYVEGIADTDGDAYAVAHDFAEGAHARYDHFVRETDPADAPYNKMHAQVKAYLDEIAEVEAMYKRLIAAKSEASRYQEKIDGLEKAKKDDDVKKERNLQKLDSERENYSALQREVTAAQKKVFGKNEVVQKMALVAYWQMNAEHVKVMQASLEKTQDFAAANYDELAAIDIASLTVSGDEARRLPEVPSSMPPAPATPKAAAAISRVPVMSS
jgi:DNA repair exonuclease SbcCD ATPase subunit